MIVGSEDQLYLNIRELPLPCVDGPIVQLPNCAKSASQSHINYRSATAWNGLSVELRLIQTYNQFKSTQKCLFKIYCHGNHHNNLDVKKVVIKLHVTLLQPND